MPSHRLYGAGGNRQRGKNPGARYVCPLSLCSKREFENRLTSSNNRCGHGSLVKQSDLKYTLMCPLKKRDKKAGCKKILKVGVSKNPSDKLKCDCYPGLPMVRK